MNVLLKYAHAHVHIHVHVHTCKWNTSHVVCTIYLERFVRSQIIGKFGIKLLFCLIAAEVVQSFTVSIIYIHGSYTLYSQCVCTCTCTYCGPTWHVYLFALHVNVHTYMYLTACSSLPGQSTPCSLRATGQKWAVSPHGLLFLVDSSPWFSPSSSSSTPPATQLGACVHSIIHKVMHLHVYCTCGISCTLCM